MLFLLPPAVNIIDSRMSNLLTIAYGTKPEYMEAALRIMMEAGAVLEIEAVQLGAEMKKLGFPLGFDQDVLKKIRCSRVLWMGVNLEVDVKDLCEVFEIGDAAQSFGDGENAALQYSNANYAIFIPAVETVVSSLNSAIILLKYLQQFEVADRIEKAMLGVAATPPEEFADNIINRLY